MSRRLARRARRAEKSLDRLERRLDRLGARAEARNTEANAATLALLDSLGAEVAAAELRAVLQTGEAAA